MLEDAEKYGFNSIVSWVPDGSSFKVHDRDEFMQRILPKYFKHQTKYKSFQRQLNLYHFSNSSYTSSKTEYNQQQFDSGLNAYRESERGLISHPFFRRGHRYLCAKITRQEPPTISRASPVFASAPKIEDARNQKVGSSLFQYPKIEMLKRDDIAADGQPRHFAEGEARNFSSGITSSSMKLSVEKMDEGHQKQKKAPGVVAEGTAMRRLKKESYQAGTFLPLHHQEGGQTSSPLGGQLFPSSRADDDEDFHFGGRVTSISSITNEIIVTLAQHQPTVAARHRQHHSYRSGNNLVGEQHNVTSSSAFRNTGWQAYMDRQQEQQEIQEQKNKLLGKHSLQRKAEHSSTSNSFDGAVTATGGATWQPPPALISFQRAAAAAAADSNNNPNDDEDELLRFARHARTYLEVKDKKFPEPNSGETRSNEEQSDGRTKKI